MRQKLLPAVEKQIDELSSIVTSLKKSKRLKKVDLRGLRSDLDLVNQGLLRGSDKVPLFEFTKKVVRSPRLFDKFMFIVHENLPDNFSTGEDYMDSLFRLDSLSSKKTTKEQVIESIRNLNLTQIPVAERAEILAGFFVLMGNRFSTSLRGRMKDANSELVEISNSLEVHQSNLHELKTMLTDFEKLVPPKVVEETVNIAKFEVRPKSIKAVYLERHNELNRVHNLSKRDQSDLNSVISWVNEHRKLSRSFKEAIPKNINYKGLIESPSFFMSAVELAEGHPLPDVLPKSKSRLKSTAAVKRGIELVRDYHKRIAHIRRSLSSQRISKAHLRALGLKL